MTTPKSEQHDDHCVMRNFYIGITRDWRRDRLWYRGRVSRMTQLNQLRQRGDTVAYDWLKGFWRSQLLAGRALYGANR